MTIESLTYKELADRLGCKLESARKMVQRKKWHRVTGNDGTVRIQVPMEELPSRDKSEDKPEEKLVPEILLRALEVQIDGLKEIVEAERKRADTEAARADAEGKRADAENGRANAEGKRADAAEIDRDEWRDLFKTAQKANDDTAAVAKPGILKRMFG
ncbi:hypothetical protein [Agrobacterium pusense]|uniref:hypothetical protein n=1 Tax=Agrobacterium pusense TaxID=648995 RepID=UPI000D337468|nr:hypothetical protein [Agrobacterium pusense]PTV70181.1 hypothetical protein DBL06_25290 [Agrobacterium pusense]